MENITLKITDKKGNLIKLYEAQPYELEFGTIRTLMRILKIEDMENQGELLKTLAGAWDEVINVLNEFFPDCNEEEWDKVKVKEVLRVIIEVSKYAISEAFVIPTEKN